MRQVADDLWMGTGTVVNWMVAREGTDLTLVDSGWPGDFRRLEASFAAVGLRTADITAVLLTHAHVDHTGGLNALWRHFRTPVFMHHNEIPLATGQRTEQATPLDVLKLSRRPRVACWGLRAIGAGGLRHPVIKHAQPCNLTGPLDLPGRPVLVPCAGHTSGHTAYLFPAQGVIATGDALVTAHPTSGKAAPHLLPAAFNTSTELARQALHALTTVDADTVVPGHGPMWSGPVKATVESACRNHDAARR